jgi:hypothetical protein
MTELTQREDIQAQVRQHFSKDGTYDKEMSETLSIFDKLSKFSETEIPANVLSLACGSAVGAEVFKDYFPKGSKFYGMDITQTQTVEFLLSHSHIHGFVEEDLYSDPLSDDALHLFSHATHWMAIHACRDLARRIVQLFRLYAKPNAHLLVVPCCLFKDNELKTGVGHMRWKSIRDLQQVRDPTTKKPTNSNWRTTTAIQARNELLASEFPQGFEDAEMIPAIHSLHNIALHFHKEKKKILAGATDVENVEASSKLPGVEVPDEMLVHGSRICSFFDSMCVECK